MPDHQNISEPFPYSELEPLVKDKGFCSIGIVEWKDLVRLSDYSPQLAEHLRNSDCKSALIAALPYVSNEQQQLILPKEPYAVIAPFAQSNYYAGAAALLKNVSKQLRSFRISRKQDYRIFVNSFFPEREMACAAGLGFIGKHNLLITSGSGSLVVIAGMMLPFAVSGVPAKPSYVSHIAVCSDCRLCLKCCPTGALGHSTPGGFEPARCLQYMAGRLVRPNPVALEAWGNMLYGCQKCQDVCPYNKKSFPGVACETGYIGPWVSILKVLEAASYQSGVKAMFKKSALDRKWLSEEVLIRNTVLASACFPNTEAADMATRFSSHENSAIAYAAKWASINLHK